MANLDNLQREPTQYLAGRVIKFRAIVSFIATLVFLSMIPNPAHALAGCASIVVTLNPSLPSKTIFTPTSNILATGTMTVTANGCKLNISNPAALYLPFGQAAQALTAPAGVTIESDGQTPTGTITGCTPSNYDTSTLQWHGNNQYYTSVTFGGQNAIEITCDITLNANFILRLSNYATAAGPLSTSSVDGAVDNSLPPANPIGWALYKRPNPGGMTQNAPSPASGWATVFVIATCTPSDITVTLDNISADAVIANVSGTMKNKPFSLILSGCYFAATQSATYPGTYGVSATFTFTQGSAANSIKNTGTATGTEVQILDGTGAPISNNSTVALGTVTSNGQTVSSTFSAQYAKGTGTVAPGSVNATATYTLTYQ